jgi:hypothetical protein
MPRKSRIIGNSDNQFAEFLMIGDLHAFTNEKGGNK